jgi:hypothetical protein
VVDVDTFLTTLYVMVDDFCQTQPPKKRPGPEASLCQSEVITLTIFARWSRFASERDFYRYADGHLRGAFPTLPSRPQFNRLVRLYTQSIEEIAVKLGKMLEDRVLMSTKHSIVLRCPSGMQSAVDMAGSPERPTSDGLTA